MDEGLITSFIEFGIAGAVIVALFWLIKYILSTHKEERTEWRREANDQQDQTRAVVRELTAAVRDINRRD